MGLETGDRIEDLNSAWPLGTDGLNNSDDHHRLIKRCTQGSFPALGPNPVTVSADEINDAVNEHPIPPPQRKVTVFTIDGTWTKTAGMLSAKVIVTGGGAGGATGSSIGGDNGGGGGGGGTVIGNLDISGIASATITVNADVAADSDGGDSTYADGTSTLVGLGGIRGGVTATEQGGVAGFATGPAGSLLLAGNDGDTASNETAGTGGGSNWGGGGGAVFNGAGRAGRNYGGAGAGGAKSGDAAGGAGKSGVIVIEESTSALV